MNTPILLAAVLSAAASLLAQSPTTPSYSSYGAGCLGSLGTPVSTSTGLPVGGQLHTFDVTNVAPNNILVLVLGFSDALQGSLPLPFDLAPIGAPGCQLLASTDILNLTAADSLGHGSFPWAVPTGFVGFQFFTQWAVLDSGANPFGFAFSEGRACVLGSSIYGVNLIANPGAEEDLGVGAGQDMEIARWRDRSGFVTTQLYNGFAVDDPTTGGSYPGAAFGNNYFYGGDLWSGSATHSIFQEIAVHNIAGDVDISKAQYDIAGWFGGWSTQDDVMTLRATFVDDLGTTLGTVQIGGLTVASAAARNNLSGYVADAAQGVLPVGTRYVKLELEAYKIVGGVYCDAAADNLSFRLTLLP